MSRTKYIMGEGLAFSEEKDMERLRKYSLKGWHVIGFKFMGYVLEKGESEDFIYSVDYRTLAEEEEEEYFDFFSSAGWSHIDSEANMHLFRGKPGTNPIYSDEDTSMEKYNHLSETVKKGAVPLILVTMLLWIVGSLSSGHLRTGLIIAAGILTVFAIPAFWTACAAYSNKWKIKGKRKEANIIKNLPMILLFVVALIILSISTSRGIVQLLTSMTIGGVALPTAIWLMMSVYQIITEKREGK